MGLWCGRPGGLVPWPDLAPGPLRQQLISLFSLRPPQRPQPAPSSAALRSATGEGCRVIPHEDDFLFALYF